MKESSRKERWFKFQYTAKKAVVFQRWVKHPTPRSRWKRFEEIIGDFAERTFNRCLCVHMFSDCSSGIHVDFMSFLKRLYACGSSRVSFAIVCLGTCLSLLNWLKEWRNCILELIKCPFQSQMIQLEEPSTTWNHMCMNLRMVRMPQVLDPILRWWLVKLLQLSFLWLCQVASSQLQASVCILLFAIMAKEPKWRP